MRNYIKAILIFSFFTLAAHAAAADNNDSEDRWAQVISLEKIIVSAEKLREPISMSASSISVVDEKALDKKKADFAKDVLFNYNDVSVTEAGAFGGQTHVRIRGALPAHTFLMIDGVKVYDPASVDGAFDFANLPVDNIQQIEITRGPQATLYGSDAIGGLISIESRKPYKPYFEAGIESGSYYTLTEYVNIGGYEKGLHYSFAFSQFDTNGISNADSKTVPNIQETDPYTRRSFAARVDYELPYDMTVGATFRSINARFKYDNPAMVPPFALQDNDQLIGKSDLTLYSIYLEHKPLSCYDYSIRYSSMDNFRRDFDYPAGMSDWYNGLANRFDFQNNFHIFNFDIISLGYEYLYEQSDSYYADFASGISDQPKVFDRNSAFYLQNKAYYGDLMGTTQSMRVSHHSQFGTNITYKIDGFYMAPTDTRLRGAWATSYKAPSLYQLDAPANPTWLFLGGNPNLRPETARSYEIGVDQYLFNKRVRLGVTYFQMRFYDLIVYNTDPLTWQSTYLNSAKAKSLGMEYEAEANFFEERLLISAGVTKLDSQDYMTDRPILRDPYDQFHLAIDVKPVEKLNIHTDITHQGVMFTLGTDKMKGYTIVDITAEYALTKNFTIYAKLNNAFDKHYQEVRGYGMPGINAYGGAKAKF